MYFRSGGHKRCHNEGLLEVLKMKKSILLLVPFIIGLVSCNDTSTSPISEDTTASSISEDISTTSSIDNQEDVDHLKLLLSKQDLSTFNEKSFFTQYRQNFTSYTNVINEEDKYIDFYNYRGSGNVGYYYNLDEETYKEIINEEGTNLFDIMCQNYGFYLLTQSATVNAFTNDDYEEKTDTARMSFIQQLSAQFDETNLQIQNFYLFADYYDDDNVDYRTFNGAIEKDILFSAYSTKTLSDIFSRVNIYDGPGYCETIDSLYYQICLSLLDSSDEEISEFIHNNHITFSESDYYSELSFEIQEDKYMEVLQENDVIPGIIKGTLHINKETKEMEEFEYSTVYFEEEADQQANYVHTASMEFEVDGYSHHGKPEGDPSTSDEPTVFTDPDEFLEQVVSQVIPSIVQI